MNKINALTLLTLPDIQFIVGAQEKIMANKTISGYRSVALHCVLEFAKKRMKRSSAANISIPPPPPFARIKKSSDWKLGKLSG